MASAQLKNVGQREFFWVAWYGHSHPGIYVVVCREDFGRQGNGCHPRNGQIKDLIAHKWIRHYPCFLFLRL